MLITGLFVIRLASQKSPDIRAKENIAFSEMVYTETKTMIAATKRGAAAGKRVRQFTVFPKMPYPYVRRSGEPPDHVEKNGLALDWRESGRVESRFWFIPSEARSTAESLWFASR
jgi:hypothetical protein